MIRNGTNGNEDMDDQILMCKGLIILLQAIHVYMFFTLIIDTIIAHIYIYIDATKVG